MLVLPGYFGPEADECGGPLCDRLVMSLQGTMYYADYVYTYWGMAVTDGDCYYNYPGGPDRAIEPNGTRTGKPQSPRRQSTTGNNPAKGPGRRNRGPGKSRPVKGPGARLAYNQYTEDPNREVYYGDASIIMGIVSAMAGQRKDRWEEGVFEYVPYYSFYDVVTEGIDSSYPWIRDKTYQMTFFRHADKY